MLVVAAVLALAAAWLWGCVVARLLWRPRAAASAFRAQGVRGPPYRFLTGCNGDVRRMRAEADGVALDARDHDYLRRVMPHFLAWKDQYGKNGMLCSDAQLLCSVYLESSNTVSMA
jgi:PHYB activation tagged suppressor 1